MNLSKLFQKIFNNKKAQQEHYLTHKESARTLVHQLLQQFNPNNQFTYHRVSIKNQKTRWGSCSSKGNLNFNYRILFLEPQLAQYIIVHELCHLKHMNHSKKFWDLVQSIFPDYQTARHKLKQISLKYTS